MTARRFALAASRFGLPFAAPIASIRGSRLRWRRRLSEPNLTMKTWLDMRYAS